MNAAKPLSMEDQLNAPPPNFLGSHDVPFQPNGATGVMPPLLDPLFSGDPGAQLGPTLAQDLAGLGDLLFQLGANLTTDIAQALAGLEDTWVKLGLENFGFAASPPAAANIPLPSADLDNPFTAALGVSSSLKTNAADGLHPGIW